jgi:hypothetical protein
MGSVLFRKSPGRNYLGGRGRIYIAFGGPSADSAIYDYFEVIVN